MNKNVQLEMQLIAASCILAIIISLTQFGLDVWGTTARGFRVIRKNATGNIIAGMLLKYYFDLLSTFSMLQCVITRFIFI